VVIPCLCAMHHNRGRRFGTSCFVHSHGAGWESVTRVIVINGDYSGSLGTHCPAKDESGQFFVGIGGYLRKSRRPRPPNVARIEHLAVSFRQHQQKQWVEVNTINLINKTRSAVHECK
jgi:hypothetical protein